MQLLLSFSLLSLLSFVRVCYGASCSSYSDCSTCASSYVGFWPFKLDCLWCPLDRKCHTWGSQFTPCLSSMNINRKKKCPISNDEGTYSANRAYTNTLLSAAAYGTDVQQCLDHVYPANDFDVKETIAVRCDSVYSDYDECIAFTAVSPLQKVIAIGFRGSISSEQVLDQVLSTLMSSKKFKIGGKVLNYFANAHRDIYPCIKDKVEALTGQYPGYKIVVTGHSLGGALASLTAASLVYDGVVSTSNLELYTYGLPKVGDKKFAYKFDKLVSNSWHVVNYRDIVSHLPPCNVLGCNTPYNGPFHHKREVYYALNGNMEVNSPYTVCEENEDDRCSNGAVTDDRCFNDLQECIDFHISYFNIYVGSVCKDGLNTTALPRPWNNQLSRTCSTFPSS